MKKFADVLKENGIRLPEKKAWMPDWLFVHIKKAFCRNWSDACRCYNQLVNEFKKKSGEYEQYDKMLMESGYDIMMPALPDIDIKPFKRPSKAADEIFAAYERLRDHDSKEVYRRAEREGKKMWAKKVLENKPEGCKLMVVKNSKYTPAKDTLEKFEASIVAGEVTGIFGMFGIPQWVAFNPEVEKTEEILLIIPAAPKNINVKYL